MTVDGCQIVPKTTLHRTGCEKHSLFTFHRFFSQYSKHWDTARATLLEVGGGPSIQISIVAVPFVGSIVHGDFDEGCNKEVRLWLDSSSGAFDWSPIVEYALTNFGRGETAVDSAAVRRRGEDVRRKVSTVVHCDATKEGMLLDPSVVPKEGFEVVIVCSSLVYTSRTRDDFFHVLKNIYGLLKEGGYFCATINGRCMHVLTTLLVTCFSLPVTLRWRMSKVELQGLGSI